MFVTLEGEEASGKTTFAYTAPLKIVGFAWDMGAERALSGTRYELFQGYQIKVVPYVPSEPPTAYWQDFHITIYEFPRPVQLDSVRIKGAKALWQHFIQLFVKATEDPEVRSLVLDTATIARRVAADAYLEGLQNVAFNPDGSRNPKEKLRERLSQIEYGRPNDDIRSIYTTAQGRKKNLVAVHHLTDEYGEARNKDGDAVQVKTGRRLLEGLLPTHRDLGLRMEKVTEEKRVAMKTTFIKCGNNCDLELGAGLLNPTWNTVMDLITMSQGGRITLEKTQPIEAG